MKKLWMGWVNLCTKYPKSVIFGICFIVALSVTIHSAHEREYDRHHESARDAAFYVGTYLELTSTHNGKTDWNTLRAVKNDNGTYTVAGDFYNKDPFGGTIHHIFGAYAAKIDGQVGYSVYGIQMYP